MNERLEGDEPWDCLAGPPVTRAEIIFWVALFCGVGLAYVWFGS